MKNHILLAGFLTLFLYSCEDNFNTSDPSDNDTNTAVYNVDPAFDYFVRKFEKEGNKRSKNLNLEEFGLIMQFSDLEENVAGRSYSYEDPVRIEIDRDYWESLRYSLNEYKNKEFLIFHEMGHGILKREHLNDFLPNGDWKTIMRGGSKVFQKSWNTNYRGFRQEYYIDELFNRKKAAPDWSLFSTEIQGNPQSDAFFSENFNNSELNWPSGSTGSRKIVREDGKYKITSRTNQGYAITFYDLEHKDYDFHFEIEYKITSEDSSSGVGLLFLGNSVSSYYYAVYHKSNRFYVGNYLDFGWYTEVINEKNVADSTMKFTLQRIDNIFYFFLNDEFFYHTDHDGIYGTKLGFFITGNTSAEFNSVMLSYIRDSQLKSKTIPGKADFKEEIIEIEPQRWKNLE